jgi:hypothetical protein
VPGSPDLVLNFSVAEEMKLNGLASFHSDALFAMREPIKMPTKKKTKTMMPNASPTQYLDIASFSV